MTKIDIARQITKDCKTIDDFYNCKDELKKENIGIFVDIPHMSKYPRAIFFSLRLGKFHRKLGIRIAYSTNQ